MTKLLMTFTATLTMLLLLGQIFFPDFPLVWMASDASSFVFIRAGIVIAVAALLFSEVIGFTVPKSILMVVAGGLFGLLGALALTDSLYLADGVIFAETAIVLLLAALEAPVRLEPTVFKGRRVGKLAVGNDFVKIG